jgi:hypothetical protein
MFNVGQKVVCVKVDELAPGLILNAVYTIQTCRWLSEKECFNPGFGVSLVEVEARESREYLPFFNASRFRPATDISIFTAMLNEKVKA